jgi:hypothetical protein
MIRRSNIPLCLFLLGLSGLSGCLQWVDILPATSENHTPRIVVEKNGLQPHDKAMITLAPGSPPITFTITLVEDEDLNDSLYAYWFFRTSSSEKVECDPLPSHPHSEPAQRQKQRQVEFSCSVGPNHPFLIAHKVATFEVFVMDRRRKQSGGRNWDEEARWGYWAWTIRLEVP